MNTSLSWINAYVPDMDVTPQQFCDDMTLSGTKVESFDVLDKDLSRIVVGQIRKIGKHPDADKLVICQVDIGESTIQIVTGAPNVSEGDKVPVVLDGGRVAGSHDGTMTPGGIRIKKGKLRGTESFGMMCSIEELGSSREMYPDAPESGVYILPEDAQTGADALELLGLHDAFFEFEITSNRVDCCSVIGIAREAAATYDIPFVPPVVKKTGNGEDISDFVHVTVKDADLCPRYCARMVRNIRLAPSPAWMQHRLASSGIRPINNIVDITNYVMEEFGQPMHAYDLDTVKGSEIIVRRAAAGEKFTTLDGQERTMDDTVLMICDGEKAIGIAGIMGGENSMITDSVKTMLFEAATFNGPNIRRSSKKIGLRTDASGLFEKGLEPENAQAAIDRACQLIEELDAGDVVGGMIDVGSVRKPQEAVKFEPDKINGLLGTDLSREEQLKYLKRAELICDPETDEILVPRFRQDIHRMADLAEEVARFYGYDNIPTTLPHGEATAGKLSYKLRIEQTARDVAEYCGFSQGMCYSFESPKSFDKLMIPKDSGFRKAIAIQNPLGEDFSIMRTLSLNGMMTSLSLNYNRRNKAVKLYELGNVYLPESLPLTELPDERMQFTLGMYGSGDFFDMKGVIEEFLEKAGMKKKCTYDPSEKLPFLHPGRQAEIIYGHTALGYLGEVHPQVCRNYDIGERVIIAVLDMPEIVALSTYERKYTGIARYPAVNRDISMTMPRSQMVSSVENVIEKNGGAYLEHYELFDIYEGSQIEAGCKSVAYSLTFRAKDKTLEEAEVNAAMEKIVKALEEMNIELRK